MNTYAATITSVTKKQGDVLPILSYTVSFTQNNNPFSTVIFNTSYPDTVPGLIAQQIATYQQADTVVAVATNPPLGPVIAPVAPTPTTQQTYQSALLVLQQLQVLVAAGVTAAQKDLTTQVTLVNSLYQSSYYNVGVQSVVL